MTDTRPPYFQQVPPGHCPRCGQPITGHPATSRHDNTTKICARCGTVEALMAVPVELLSDEEAIAILQALPQAPEQEEDTPHG